MINDEDKAYLTRPAVQRWTVEFFFRIAHMHTSRHAVHCGCRTQAVRTGTWFPHATPPLEFQTRTLFFPAWPAHTCAAKPLSKIRLAFESHSNLLIRSLESSQMRRLGLLEVGRFACSRGVWIIFCFEPHGCWHAKVLSDFGMIFQDFSFWKIIQKPRESASNIRY